MPNPAQGSRVYSWGAMQRYATESTATVLALKQSQKWGGKSNFLPGTGTSIFAFGHEQNAPRKPVQQLQMCSPEAVHRCSDAPKESLVLHIAVALLCLHWCNHWLLWVRQHSKQAHPKMYLV